jgi:hypothetical protein
MMQIVNIGAPKMTTELKVRNLPPETVASLASKARARGMGRETFVRDALIALAQAEAVDVKLQRLAAGTWPFADDSAGNRVALTNFVDGFLTAVAAALKNGMSDADVAAAVLGPAALGGSDTEDEPAAVPAPRPHAAARSALPRGVELVSRTYDVQV